MAFSLLSFFSLCVSNGSAGVFRFGQSERWPYCYCVCCMLLF